MSVRLVKDPAPAWSPPGADPDTSANYEIKVVTPLFGGGAAPKECDPAYPIGPAAVRGHLRFWWRALVAGRYSSSSKLAEDEADLWGSDQKKGQVALSVRLVQAGKQVDVFSWPIKDGKMVGFPSLLQSAWPRYALFPFQGAKEAGQNTLKEQPSKATVGVQFELGLRWSGINAATVADVRGAVAAWVAYGGVGARTRRGCGSLDCAKAGAFDGGALPDHVETTLLAGAERVLGKPMGDPVAAWNVAVGLYQDFRQGVPFARNPGSDPSAPGKPGRSKWPEPDTIRRAVHQWCPKHTPSARPDGFPRADLGLPIVFQFKDKNAGDPNQTCLQGPDSGHLRKASPVITKAVRTAGGQWAPMVLVLTAPHAWDLGDLELGGTHRSVTKGEIEIPPGAKVGPISGPIREAVLGHAAAKWTAKKEAL
jgi:CRISPR-associated protein Cmr1